VGSRLNVFSELARVVAAGPYRVEEVLDGICTQVRTAFGFDRALLVRLDEYARTVHAVVLQGVEWPGDQWLRLEAFPFLERAMETRRTVVVGDPVAERAIPGALVERFGVGEILAVPLSVEDRCLGFLVLDRNGAALGLDPDDLELLTALGAVAAVLIEKADQYAELQAAHEELRRLDEVKSDFVSIASHELRNPIAVVHGITSTLHLRGDALTGDQLHQLRSTLYDQSSRLAALTEQLLDLSRLEAGAVRFEPCRFHPREHIDALLPRLAPDRLPDVRVSVPPELDVFTDPYGFERIVGNLIMNALRYGRPPVEVDAETNGQVRVVVQDHGDGVEPAFIPRLFDRFSRADRSHRSDGAGLGLAIAHSFALALGGELGYERRDPHGACFTLTLPQA
jgi:signal transduction histidine kinase